MQKLKPQKLASEENKTLLQQKVLELFREIIGGVKLSDITLPESLEGQDRLDFARFCHETYNNRFFKQVLETLYYPQIMHAGTQAPNYDEVTFNRATGNGIMLVGEMFQKWSNIYDEDYSSDPRPKFDANKSFEASGE